MSVSSNIWKHSEMLGFVDLP